MHKVLERQLKKAFGSLEAAPKGLEALLKLVDDAYVHYDEDRTLIERSLEISSRELVEQTSLLKAALNSIANGILVVDLKGKTVVFNEQLLKMWNVSSDLLSTDAENRLHVVIDQVKNPDTFTAKVEELYGAPAEASLDIVELKDGRVFERYSRPQFRGEKIVGRVWSFLDVTERRRGEQEEQGRLEELERMNKLMVDRELKMIELKKELDALKASKS